MTDPRDPQEPVQEDEVSPGALTEDMTVEGSTGAAGGSSVDAADDTDRMDARTAEAGADEEEDTVAAAPPVEVTAAATAGGAPAPAEAAKRASSAPEASVSEAPELPWVDDPVSKWWVGIIVATFVILFAWAIFFGDALDGLFEAAEPTAPSIPSAVESAGPSVTAVPLLTPQATAATTAESVTAPPATQAPASASPIAGSTDVPDTPASPAG
jgi:hypothetical protein